MTQDIPVDRASAALAIDGLSLQAMVRCEIVAADLMNLVAEQETLRARFERFRGDTRVEAQIRRLTELDGYLDRLRGAYLNASELLGLAAAPADSWPVLDSDRVSKAEEVSSLVLLVPARRYWPIQFPEHHNREGVVSQNDASAYQFSRFHGGKPSRRCSQEHQMEGRLAWRAA